MSADHRKPVVAFVVLAFLAAALIGFQRADAQAGRFLASALGTTGNVEGVFPDAEATVLASEASPRETSAELTSVDASGRRSADAAERLVVAAESEIPVLIAVGDTTRPVVGERSRDEARPDGVRGAPGPAHLAGRRGHRLSQARPAEAVQWLSAAAPGRLRAEARDAHRALLRVRHWRHPRTHERTGHPGRAARIVRKANVRRLHRSAPTTEMVFRPLGELRLLD